mmetsp:Transcript_21320/g.48144  ORF Transcript_21320/g.48144 Transcript_21320/m.48144 type:complete len:253 (-) Transcript_21320:1431-2189(-)
MNFDRPTSTASENLSLLSSCEWRRAAESSCRASILTEEEEEEEQRNVSWRPSELRNSLLASLLARTSSSNALRQSTWIEGLVLGLEKSSTSGCMPPDPSSMEGFKWAMAARAGEASFWSEPQVASTAMSRSELRVSLLDLLSVTLSPERGDLEGLREEGGRGVRGADGSSASITHRAPLEDISRFLPSSNFFLSNMVTRAPSDLTIFSSFFVSSVARGCWLVSGDVNFSSDSSLARSSALARRTFEMALTHC